MCLSTNSEVFSINFLEYFKSFSLFLIISFDISWCPKNLPSPFSSRKNVSIFPVSWKRPAILVFKFAGVISNTFIECSNKSNLWWEECWLKPIIFLTSGNIYSKRPSFSNNLIPFDGFLDNKILLISSLILSFDISSILFFLFFIAFFKFSSISKSKTVANLTALKALR